MEPILIGLIAIGALARHAINLARPRKPVDNPPSDARP